MDLQLAGKTVFVTGASGGIGSVIARSFVAEGARVGVHYRSNQASAETLVTEFGSQAAVAVGGDLTDETVVDAAFAEVAERFGTIDILIANAGVWPSAHVPIHEMTVALVVELQHQKAGRSSEPPLPRRTHRWEPLPRGHCVREYGLHAHHRLRRRGWCRRTG